MEKVVERKWRICGGKDKLSLSVDNKIISIAYVDWRDALVKV